MEPPPLGPSTLLLSVTGQRSAEMQSYLAGLDVNASSGSFYALEASRRMGLGDTGAVRVGLAPCTDSSDVARLVEGLRWFVSET
jgi:selenocysteine lyase/cysteine desulfurase